MNRVWGRRTGGFTLLELVVTMSIALVLTGLAASSLSPILSRTRENKDVLAFEGYLREARSIARSRLRQVDVTYSSGILTISPVGDTPILYNVGAEIVSVTITDADGIIVYNSSGGLDELVSPVITLNTRSLRAYQYTILPAIGTLRVTAL